MGGSQPSASRALAVLAGEGLIRRVRSGLWALDPDATPITLVPYLTSPLPAYVSGWSALSAHGMIEQLPGATFVASLGRTQWVPTAFGTFDIHHLAPELWGGFTGDPAVGYTATPEKALFDSVYLRAPRGGRTLFPELTLPQGFATQLLEQWTDRILSARLRTMVKRRLEETLAAVAGGSDG